MNAKSLLREFHRERTGVRYSAPHGMHDDCVIALALAAQHYTANKSRRSWADWVAPTDAKLERLIQEELARRDKALREALAERGQRYEDFVGGQPLEVGLARIRGW